VNEVVLSGVACDMHDMRYTPAGIPVLEFSVRHSSTQAEAGQTRKVELDMPAIAIGPLAQRLASADAANRPIVTRGFLARRSMRSAQVVLHASDIEFK
jgi:primosomal replication protein N